jgi:hypothetical protein
VNIKISGLSHKKALILALLGIVGGLIISVTSFANTSSTASINIASGSSEFGFTVAQGATSSTLVSSSGVTATGIQVDSATNYSVGDHILIHNPEGGPSVNDVDPGVGTTRGFYTITGIDSNGTGLFLINEDTLETNPTLSPAVEDGDVVSEPSVYGSGDTGGSGTGLAGFVTAGVSPSWTTALNSATSVNPGNYFIVNLKGLSDTDSAFVEILNTNPSELVKNYTYLNRTFAVYVYCDSTSNCPNSSNADPYTGGPDTNAGSWSPASDVLGETINDVGDLLTLANARVQFNLIGDYVYSITMDGGAVFTIDTSEGTGDSLSPDDQIGITAR